MFCQRQKAQEALDPASNVCRVCAESHKERRRLANLIIRTMMSMFVALSQKSDDSEKELEHRGRLRPAAEMVPGAEMMSHSGDSHCNENDGDDLHMEEEKDELELQQRL